MPHRGGGHRIRFPRGPLLIETVAADAVGKLDVVAPREVKSPGASSGAFDETSETLIEPDALHPQSHSANQAEASFGGIGPTANESSHPLEKRYFGSRLICYTRPANGWRRNHRLNAPPSGVKSNHLVMRESRRSRLASHQPQNCSGRRGRLRAQVGGDHFRGFLERHVRRVDHEVVG